MLLSNKGIEEFALKECVKENEKREPFEFYSLIIAWNIEQICQEKFVN